MSARTLGGRDVASRVREEAEARLRAHLARGGRTPRVRAFAVAPDGSGQAYLQTQARALSAAGFEFQADIVERPMEAAEAKARLEDLSADPEIDGIIVSWPLPVGLAVERVLEGLDPRKDVDALTTACIGRLAVDPGARAPATARAVMALLGQAGADLVGSRVTLIGCGRTAGLPTMLLLLHAGAPLTVVHRQSHDVRAAVRDADVVVAAAGSPHLVRTQDVRPGAIVIDVGITEADGRLFGDADPGVAMVAGAYTPVPGGVGPVTVSHLLLNVLEVVGA